jgi:hypothetical protein
MNGLAEVISLDSRRSRLRKGRAVPAPVAPAELAPEVRRRRVAIFCAFLVTVVAALTLVDRLVVPHPSATPPAGALTSEVSQGLHRRTLDDVVASCALPAARAGILRQHCLDQARFLQRLPECTGDCVRLTRAVLGGGF